ncbi:cytochrome P450 [Gymnopilus junonius]|uniref:Cytochrome P450 n=1 Tax=Gymnopilus junonius TaxID=109634 RepID=A0A9P5NYK6_GYMJU|nr:cytochrome P450 [Gymnopilus junonius]
MSLSTPQISLCFVVAWVCWRLLWQRLFPSVWENVPGPEATDIFPGSMLDLVDTKNGWDFHRKLRETYGSIIRLKGMFGANHLYVFDPKALHHILVKDQYIYDETEVFIENNKLVFGQGLLTTLGERHRRQRKMLNPVFSIAHLREMVPIFYEVSHKVRKTFIQKVQNGPQEVEILGWMTRLALELIGQSGLGYSFDELTENAVPHEYGIASKQLVPVQSQPILIMINRILTPKLTKIGTPAFRRWVVDHIPSKNIRKVRDIIDTLHRTSVEIFESKKKAIEAGDSALEAQIGKGKDVISILLKENMKASEDDKLADEEVLGQITTFTFAATDTTSTAITRTLHLLAQHKDAQVKLREELRKARTENNGQDIGYDTLVSLPYLDAICRETLRMYSPVSTLMRSARQDIVLPLGQPIKGINGEEIHEIPLPKGTNIHMSVLNSNRNPELWGPDAEDWKPERWLKPLPEALVGARIPGIYSHLMTFLGGSRSCIGFKFSQLEMKVVLALLVETLEFSLSDKSVFWQMSGIVTPIIGTDQTKPALPMIVSLAK